MGRRAKNKQSAPEPLEKSAPKKLGKRKAEADVDDSKSSQRPKKKIKDINDKSKEKTISKKSKSSNKDKSNVESDDGSEGWEDVEDDADLKVHAKLVPSFSF